LLGLHLQYRHNLFIMLWYPFESPVGLALYSSIYISDNLEINEGPRLPKKIRALASYRDYTFAAYGNEIAVFKRAHQVCKRSSL